MDWAVWCLFLVFFCLKAPLLQDTCRLEALGLCYFIQNILTLTHPCTAHNPPLSMPALGLKFIEWLVWCKQSVLLHKTTECWKQCYPMSMGNESLIVCLGSIAFIPESTDSQVEWAVWCLFLVCLLKSSSFARQMQVGGTGTVLLHSRQAALTYPCTARNPPLSMPALGALV